MSEKREFKGIAEPAAADVNNAYDFNGNTYLHRLCINNAPPEIIRRAVEVLGADVCKPNRQGLPPLAFAIQFCSTETAACLIDLGAELYTPTKNGGFFNAALTASYVNTRDDGMLETILEKGGAFHVNKGGIYQDGTDSGIPCLHVAIREKLTNKIQPLLEAGAFVDMEAGLRKLTPLMVAAQTGFLPCIRLLLDGGAVTDLSNSVTGETPLHWAIENRKPDAAHYLIARGADVNAVTEGGITPLLLAAQYNMQSTVDLLLKAKADPNARHEKSHNETPLMRAAKNNHMNVARILLENGADPLLCDKFNRTASAHARNTQNYIDDYYRRSDSYMTEYLEKAENEALARKLEDVYKQHKKKNRPGAPG